MWRGRGDRVKRDERDTSFLKELPILVGIAVLVALVLRAFVVQAFWIPTGSMENTLLEGDRVLVSKLSYRWGDPERGDVIVFDAPPDAPVSEDELIKRVIGLAGETVQITGGRLHIDGEPLEEPYRKDQLPMPDYGPYKVPSGALFVMGDNRSASQDSRFFGAVPRASVVGKAIVRFWPLDRIGGLGGG